MIAPAEFLGVQDGFGVVPDFALYNLTAAIAGHPAGSTVSEHTLRRLGYVPAGDRGQATGDRRQETEAAA